MPIFEDSQEDIVREPLHFNNHGSSLIHQLQDAASSSPAQLDQTSSRRVRESSASNTTARAKLRHDNSQIDFAPIESSPTGGDYVDSQLLTDHQREVRERQHDTAAMFPDISSSPPKQLKSRSLELPAYSRPGQGYNADDEEPRSTPMFNLQEYGAQQDVPSSSPTPKTRKQGHAQDVLVAPYVTSSAAEHLFDTNIPSSPPGVDDENDLPADPSVIKDSFVAPNRNVESAMGQRYGDLEEELDEDVVAQLVGDVSNLSDSRVDKVQRPTSSSLASDDGNESDLPSSEIDEEVSQQLENEVIAQALRQSRTLSSTRRQVLPDDTTVDEDQLGLRGAGSALNIPDYDEDIGSFDDMTTDLPQGTAGSFSETVRNKIHVDEAQDELSPTEKDSSFIELPIRCSPGKTRSLPPSVLSKAPADETMVEDSFAGLHNDSKKSTQAKQQTPKPSGKSNKKQSKSHTKRKSLTTLDDIKAKKRPKKDDTSSTKQPPEGVQRATIDSDSDESVFSNIQVDSFSMDEQMVDVMASSPKDVNDKTSQPTKAAPEQNSEPKRRKGARPTERASQSPRASPRLSGAAPEPALAPSRTRKSRLSKSQTTEPDENETIDVTGHKADVMEEAPARKRRKGRGSRKSSQASNPPSFAAASSHSSPRTSFAQTDEATEDARGRRRSGGGQAKAEKKRKRSYDDKESTGSTAGHETQAGQQELHPGASQGSTTHGDEISQRPKVQPQSIIQRFKRLLADCKKVVLGQEELTEIDKLMLEVKREVNAAAQRGDGPSGSS